LVGSGILLSKIERRNTMNPTPQQVENRKTIKAFLTQKSLETGKKEFTIEGDPEIMAEFSKLIQSMK
jgi:hypothetical protein